MLSPQAPYTVFVIFILLFSGGQKTVEGTVASIIFQLVFLYILDLTCKYDLAHIIHIFLWPQTFIKN